MGMLINGIWSNEDRIISNGNYIRQTSAFSHEVPDETINNIIFQPDRYLLIGSNSCQWSHRTMLFRELKGLSDCLPLHIAHGPRLEGYAINGGKPWTVPGTTEEIVHLHQLYSIADADFTGRSTVPVLWDSYDLKIISNESTQIMKALDKAGDIAGSITQGDTDNTTGEPIVTFYPPDLTEEMSYIDDEIYHGLSNGVYKAGFAQTQEAYDHAVQQVFQTLDALEDRLTNNRYLMGSTITASDWKLFTTLIRFDLVYYILHRCSKKRIVDYPNLWGYARDLYAMKGVSNSIDFEIIRMASFQNDTESNPFNIIPIATEINWNSPHNRG